MFSGVMTTDHANGGSEDSQGEWEALARYLAGESSPAEAAEMQRFLGSSAQDSALVGSMQRVFDRLPVTASAGDIDVDAAFARVMQRRDVEAPASRVPFTVTRGDAPRFGRKPQRASSRPRWMTPAIAAAAAFIAFGAWRVVNVGDGDSTKVASVAPAAQTLRTGVGARDSMRLSDGSRVLLAPMSELSFSTDGAERVATLVGEGYFDVVHDEAHPFVVRTGDAEVRDIGTSFSVHGGDQHDVTVVVTSGIVELGGRQGTPQGTPQSPTTSKSTVRLEKGDVGVRHPDGRTTMRRGAATSDDVAWTRGALVFRDTPFRDVADRVHRWYGIELRAADSAIASRTVTADITGENVDRVLQVLSLSLGADVQRQGALAVFRDGDRGGGGKR